MSNVQLQVEEINKLSPTQIIEDSRVKERFIYIWNMLWGEGKGEGAYEREATYYNRYISENFKTINAVTRMSIFQSFLDLAICGLSLEQGVRALCYLQPRSVKFGVDQAGQDLYEGRLGLTISGYGELVLRERSGQIKYADNPVIVYQEDSFSFTDRDGRKSVSYTCNLPHTSKKIVACFIRIVRNDGSTDYSVMFEEDWIRLADYSEKNNTYYDKNKRQRVSRGANELYRSSNGGIDTGFLVAKCIKHAFKTYPKVKIGKETMMEADEQSVDIDSLYNMDSTPEKHKPFGEEKDTSTGVTVETSDDDDDDGAF